MNARSLRGRASLLVVVAAVAASLVGCGSGSSGREEGLVGSTVTPPDLTQVFQDPAPVGGLGVDQVQGDLALRCKDGDLRACDFLYQRGAPGSEYTQYAFSCGGRLDPPPQPGEAPNCNLRASRELRAVGGEPPVGDSPSLDRLARRCAEYDGLEACDQLFRDAGDGNDYVDYAVTCGFRTPDTRPNACAGYLGVPAGVEARVRGDAELDVLASECFAARMSSCDELYSSSDRGSDYEAYAQTCGGRLSGPVERVPPACDLRFNDPVPTEPVGPPDDLEGDEFLDRLVQECADADLRSCDQLFFRAPLASDYENYGATCGGRYAALRVNLEFSAAGECEARVSYIPEPEA